LAAVSSASSSSFFSIFCSEATFDVDAEEEEDPSSSLDEIGDVVVL
jgi:hypothetical protein